MTPGSIVQQIGPARTAIPIGQQAVRPGSADAMIRKLTAGAEEARDQKGRMHSDPMGHTI
jgi:hypothetical protein